MTITMKENQKHDGARVTLQADDVRCNVFVNYKKFGYCEIYITNDYNPNNDRARLSYFKGKISMRIINKCGKCADIAMCDTMEQAEALKKYVEKISKKC